MINLQCGGNEGLRQQVMAGLTDAIQHHNQMTQRSLRSTSATIIPDEPTSVKKNKCKTQ